MRNLVATTHHLLTSTNASQFIMDYEGDSPYIVKLAEELPQFDPKDSLAERGVIHFVDDYEDPNSACGYAFHKSSFFIDKTQQSMFLRSINEATKSYEKRRYAIVCYWNPFLGSVEMIFDAEIPDHLNIR